jgi:hypothetical protein
MGPAGLALARRPRQLHHQRPANLGRTPGQFVEEGLHRGNIGKAMHALRCGAQFGGGLRAAQQQDRQQGHGLVGDAQDAADVVRIARDPRPARFDDQRVCPQAIDDRLHLGVAGLDDRIAIVFLVAARPSAR